MGNKKGIVHFLPLLVVGLLAVGSLVLFSTSKQINSTQPQGLVLKDSDEQEDNSGSGNSGSGSDSDDDHDNSSESGSSSSDDNDNHDAMEVEDEDESGDDNVGVRLQTSSQGDDERLEVRLSETEKVRVRTEDGEKRIDVYQGGVKVRFEYEDGKFAIKAETEDEGDSGEIDDDELFKIVDRLDREDIKISTESGRVKLTRGNASAVTDFPLTLDVDANSLIVTTPAGEKVVTVLPDVAIGNLIIANTISKVLSGEIELGEANGEAVYIINGVLNQKLLGVIPVEIKKQVSLSAESGKTVNVSQSFFSRLLSIFAF